MTKVETNEVIKRLRKKYKDLGLTKEAKILLGTKEYIKMQLKVAQELLQKARWARDEKDIASYLLVVSSVIENCLDELGVNK